MSLQIVPGDFACLSNVDVLVGLSGDDLPDHGFGVHHGGSADGDADAVAQVFHLPVDDATAGEPDLVRDGGEGEGQQKENRFHVHGRILSATGTVDKRRGGPYLDYP